MRKRLLQVLLPVFGGALLLLAVILIGGTMRAWVRQQDRTAISFADIDCEPPPGMERGFFLDEVQYLAGFPDRVQLLDDTLPRRLAEAFVRHPWVEKVEKVEILSPKWVRVRPIYRMPVLAVRQAGGLRAVDRNGVLLPANAATDGLRVYPGIARPPSGPAGTRWGDDAVEEAAREVAFVPY